MPNLVRKRNCEVVKFDVNKVFLAIKKAFQATSLDGQLAENITHNVSNILNSVFAGESVPTVEQIQDIVEIQLIKAGYLETAKAYIIYRATHAHLRETKNIFNEAANLIDRYIGLDDWKVKENSNMGYSLQGLNNYISSQFTSMYWLNNIYDAEVREAHESGALHLHDLGLLSVYCCGWDLQQLLEKGLGGVADKVESGPPKHFGSALGQIVNFFYTLQGEAAGAQAFSNFDTYLAPFIYYDKLDYDQVYQAMQEFVFNVNVPTRVGFQTPFTNITMDLEPPSYLRDLPVIIGGKYMDKTYKDFQNEMDLLNRAFCEVMMKGDYKGRIFTFPIPTYNVTQDFNWDNPNLESLWEMTARYGVPYFANFINSDMKPDDVRSMCCRLRLDNRELRKRGGGLFSSNPMTGSIGVVTINLPRIGYLSKGSEEAFMKQLDGLLTIARFSLITKRKVLERLTDQGLYPYSRVYLETVKQVRGGYWSNHFNTIGILGMNEACINLLGQDIASEQGDAFAKRTLNYIRDRLVNFQEEDGHLYNLEATPGEGTTYRFASIDKKLYPGIHQSGQKHTYYTNSTHLPVGHTADIFEALDHQDELQTMYTGGTVLHGFIGESINDTAVVKKLVRKIASNYHLPYFTITPTFSICPVHGFVPGEHHICPIAAAESENNNHETLVSIQS